MFTEGAMSLYNPLNQMLASKGIQEECLYAANKKKASCMSIEIGCHGNNHLCSTSYGRIQQQGFER